MPKIKLGQVNLLATKEGFLRNTRTWIKALLIGLATLPPTAAFWASAQSHVTPDIADRVLFGPKAARSFAPDAALPKDRDEFLIRLKPGADASSLAARHGLGLLKRLQSDNGWIVLKGRAAENARGIAAELRADPDVLIAGVNQQTEYKRTSFTPNDPYFLPNNPGIGWDGEWHLVNNIGGTVDADVKPAWDQDITGSGIVIGIVDDCLQKNHPDLAPNFTPSNSWDFGQNDADPSPVNPSDEHGTSVAGVAAARGGNGIGVTGAAPLARLAGLRIDFNAQSSQQFVDATLFHTANGSESIKIENHSYGYTAPFISTPLERQALATSAATETIHVFAAGNERGNRAQDSNTLDLQSSPDSITVAALGSDGKFASYSSFGSNVFVCAPSNSNGMSSITTTDVMGTGGYNPSNDSFPDQNYNAVFGGTSSAAPLVSGVLALVKQANPALNERLAKHLIVRSSKMVDPTDATAASGGGWTRNGAGFYFDENYGFGCIDAGQLVTNALLFQGVTKLESQVVGPVTTNTTIPDNNATGIKKTFSITSTTPLEDVLLQTNVIHPYRGDLEIWLRSPMGTLSRLKSTALGATASTSDSGADIHWTFSSNAFWGEVPAGAWTVIVKDLALGDTGTLKDFTFTAHMGTPILKDNAKFVTQNVPTTMVAGQSYTATFQFLNNGASTWTKSTWFARSENPNANTTWGPSSINLATGESIAPSFSKTFSLKLFAPMNAGTYDFQWRMHHNGITSSFGDFTPDAPVTVTIAPDAARSMSISAPTTVTPGSTFPVTITMRNVGSNAWIAGSPYNLKAVTSSTKWGNPTVQLTGGDNIVRGSDKVFTFNAIAPATPGSYVIQYQMANGTVGFGDRTTAQTIKVQ